jgi:hypothetical protein
MNAMISVCVSPLLLVVVLLSLGLRPKDDSGVEWARWSHARLYRLLYVLALPPCDPVGSYSARMSREVLRRLVVSVAPA